MNTLTIYRLNHTTAVLTGDNTAISIIADSLKFQPKGYYFMPAYKMGKWDGYIRPLNGHTGTFNIGLLDLVIKNAHSRGYVVEKDKQDFEYLTEYIPLCSLDNIYSGSVKITPYDYQIESVKNILKNKRAVIESPTGSGKSLIIALLFKSLLDSQKYKKILLLVPTVSLVQQMYSDFEDYFKHDDSFITEDICHKIKAGSEKDSEKQIYISTWQSIHKIKSKKYFEQFDCVVTDETHKASGNSITKILESCTNAIIKVGLTGTLPNAKMHRTQILGLFGPVMNTTSISDLQNKGILSNLKVRTIKLVYSENVPALPYKDELDWIVTHPRRNKFICTLAGQLKGNTLILFQLVGKQGKPLYTQIKEQFPDKNVYLIYGGTKPDEREQIRHKVNNDNDSIIIASYQTFQEGINIKNLHNVIFASPSKSEIRVGQSIGRGLRTHESKDYCTLYDIADDLRSGRKSLNHTLKHFKLRLEMYLKEGFELRTDTIQL